MIRHEVEAFLRRSGMGHAAFCRKVAKDPRLVTDLRNGRQPRPSLATKIRNFISEYQL